ncbi:MAG TPA: hypothetical protein VH475_04025 [Tepidisphaeraceae bacterium]|jgi:hypothetical protein
MSLEATVSDPLIREQATVRATTVPAENRSGPGFALTWAASFLIPLAAVMAVNILGNGTGLFPSKLNPAVSDRPWKARRIDHQARHERGKPEVLVMGSSRMMQVQPPYVEALTGHRTFNWGVSAAGPLDWLTQLRYALDSGIKPRLIIVGVDEFALGGNLILNRFEIQNAAHWGLFRRMPFPENLSTLANAVEQVRLESTWESLKILANPPVARKRSMKRVSYLLLGDGYLIYRDRVVAKAAGTYDLAQSIRQQSVDWRLRLDQVADPLEVLRPAERNIELFEQFLDLARSNGIEVRVAMLPLHPYYVSLTLTPAMKRIRTDASAILARVCAERGFRYRDFTSLDSFGGSADEFWDGAHQTPENLRRMINTLFDLPPAQVVAKVPNDFQILENPPAVTTLNTW